MGSELVYYEEAFDDLINIIKNFSGDLSDNKKTAIFLSFRIRLPELTENFFLKFSNYFEYEIIDDNIVKEYYPFVGKLKVIYAWKK